MQGKPTKKARIFIPTEPLKSLEKKGQTLKETTWNSSKDGGKKGTQQKNTNKEGKDRVVHSSLDLRSHWLGQGPLNGGVSNGGGFPIWTCPSFFVLFCPFLSFWDFPGDFPDLSADSPGIFPIGPFPLSQPIISTYREQSRKGPRHNLDLSRRKWETPGFGNTPV